MLLTGLGGQMNLLTDYIVVSLVLEPVAVTVFSITQRLISVLGTVISSFGDASWAGLAELRAANRHDLFEQRLLELVRTFLGAGLCLLATFAAFNSHFVKLWVGPQYYAGNAVTVLTAAQTIIVGYFMIFGLLVDMSGDTRYRVTVALPGAALNLALSIFLGRKLGLYGITLATVIAYLAGEAWFSPYLACTRYGISGRRLIRETLRSLALSAPWVAAVWWAADRPWHGHGWTSFAASFAIASGLTMAYVWFVTLRAVDRTAWVARIRQMMSSQSKLGRAE
jgi:O-antigen/teichoic acid export membrane protein